MMTEIGFFGELCLQGQSI